MPRKPKYRKHTASDRAFVEVRGKRIYLPGRYGSPESRLAYRNTLDELAAYGNVSQIPSVQRGRLVANILLAYLDWAKNYYPPPAAGNDGEFRRSMRLIKKYLGPMFGELPVADFGPLKLKELQSKLVEDGYSRAGVNARVQAAVRIFRWAVSEQMATPEQLVSLETVRGLRKGRTAAPEAGRDKSLGWGDVEAVLPHLNAVVRDMVLIQWHSGCRPEAVCGLNPGQVDRLESPWLWRPERHKNDWRGHELRIYLGPKAQAILLPYLDRPAGRPCFSPREARRNERHGDRYTTRTYRQAVLYGLAGLAGLKRTSKPTRAAIEAAGVVYWSPHQLRHARGQSVRDLYGIEGSQAALGHASVSSTEIYAGRLDGFARKIASEFG